jgi:hypothetical protein
MRRFLESYLSFVQEQLQDKDLRRMSAVRRASTRFFGHLCFAVKIARGNPHASCMTDFLRLEASDWTV